MTNRSAFLIAVFVLAIATQVAIADQSNGTGRVEVYYTFYP
jgi:hypothetical protein